LALKINAYLLAADPTWIRASVSSYYDHVDKIVVSYDSSSRGWTGATINVAGCLTALRQIDSQHKMIFAPGDFVDTHSAATTGDTRQRREALALASQDADWVLQIDTDEVLPSFGSLRAALACAERLDLPAVEWPMRVLYRTLRDGTYLQVVSEHGEAHFEYPGPIAVRRGAHLTDCRRTDGSYLRPLVQGDVTSLQIRRQPVTTEHRAFVITPADAIWHNSWARSPKQVRRKVATWGHNQGLRSHVYFVVTWLPSPMTWRRLRNFHPFASGLWPRLAPVSRLPFVLDREDVT
jgi:hypothetical protein